MSKINPQLNFWANILLFLGFSLLVFFCYLIYQRYSPQNLAFTNLEVRPVYASQEDLQPMSLKIDAIHLLLGIAPAEIRDNKWESSTVGVSHLKTSVIPGEKGNAILYGHNWPNLLGNLKKVKPGDKVTIIYSNNSSKDFEVEYLTKVSPKDTSILKNSEDNRITLYTCTGFLDQERLVVVAKLINS